MQVWLTSTDQVRALKTYKYHKYIGKQETEIFIRILILYFSDTCSSNKACGWCHENGWPAWKYNSGADK